MCRTEDGCANVTAGTSKACIDDIDAFCSQASADDCYYLSLTYNPVCMVKDGKCVFDRCVFSYIENDDGDVVGCDTACKKFEYTSEEDGESYTEAFCANPCYVQDVCNDYYDEADSFDADACAELGCPGTADFSLGPSPYGDMTVCTSGQPKLQPAQGCEDNKGSGGAGWARPPVLALALGLGLLAMAARAL